MDIAEVPQAQGPGARGLFPRRRRGSSVARFAIIGATATYSWFAVVPKPFTAGADLFCAVAFGAMAAAIAVVRLTRRDDEASDSAAGGSICPWISLLLIFGAWELATYFAGLGAKRHDFPTFSSIYGELARFHAAKACLFFLWILLGWELLRR
jgi:hypothetical protein